jgi:serine/threonine protein kinase
MDSSRTCELCQSPLPADSPRSVCPACTAKTGAGTKSGETTLLGSADGEALPPSPAEIAQYFPQLEILDILGEGGMGVVYKARQPNLDRIVALKILAAKYSLDATFAKRFQREAKALAKLNHPNIVAIFDFGQAGPYYFFLMEYVDGMNLRELEQSRRVTPEEALALVPKICDALQYAHDEGVVHRDIKPGNILVDSRGRVKIADFGLAKLRGQEAPDTTLTTVGTVMGTPRYMAPEQMDTPDSVDHRADIYSLGVVFYELLTGEVPMGRFEPPSQKVEVDVRLDEVVLHSLERDVNRRYQHARDVKTDVETISDVREFVPRRQSNAKTWGVVATVVIVIVTGFVALFATMAKAKKASPAQQSNKDAKVTASKPAPGTKPAEAPATAPRATPLETGSIARWQKVLDDAGIRRRLTQNGADLLELDLSQSDVADLSPLKGMPLAKLQMISCANVSNLEPLRGMPLEELRVSRTKVSDLSPLSGMKLKRFWAANAPIQDIRPLAGMPLEYVDIQSTKVTDISPLKGMKINFLQLVTLKINDFTPVKGMPLETFAASYFDDLSLIADAPLQALTLVSTGGLRDLGPLKGKQLVSLNMGGTSVSDLRPLAGMPLRSLGARGCPIRDLSPLSGMSIERLRLEDTPVTDLRPLASMGVTELILQGCTSLRDVSALARCKELELLSLPANAQNIESLRQLPKLKKLLVSAESSPNINWNTVQPIEQFWKSFDARQKVNSK